MDPSTLRDRLRGIVQVSSPDAVSGFSRTNPSDVVSGRTGEDFLGGAWRETSQGRSFVVTHRFASDDPYGKHRVGEFANRLRNATSAASLLIGTAQAPFVFFDLETTGLNGGAGTSAFLVGCGAFDRNDNFIVEQHLMLDYAGERAMLGAVADHLELAGALVSFNGKSFDAPMLETRYLFHRLESPCSEIPHVDVLHPARRFWRHLTDAGCSLSALEEQVLGVKRAGDVPGFEIPARYFHFVRTGDARPLAQVLEHNRLDLLSLAGLTARIFYLVEAGPAYAATAFEAHALGRVYDRAELQDRAEEAFERTVMICDAAAQSWSGASIKIDALRSLALMARRQRRYETAAKRWRGVLDEPECPASIAREATQALAIHHEHRVRDLAKAKMYALKGLECVTAPASPKRESKGAREGGWGDAIRHRLARIERKIVSEPPSLFPF